MAKKQHCKCEQEECECPEWIFTFADLVMLMMGFFVILWVLKPNANSTKAGPEMDQRWLEVVAKIREAFKYMPDPESKDEVDMYMIMKKLEQMDPLKGKGLGAENTIPKKGVEGTSPEVTTIREGIQNVCGGKILFTPNSIRLEPNTIVVLDELANMIRGHKIIILVKGHTSQDDFTDGGSSQQKMDLSIRRAQVVADYLVSKNVEPNMLRVQGCSTFEPVAQMAYNPDKQAVNRRVEVEETSTLLRERQGENFKSAQTKATDDLPVPAKERH